MIQVPFESYDFRTRTTDKKLQIFDLVRKKFVALTPEEWVRQHWIHFLVHNMRYPKTLIRVEMGLKVNTLQKRSDIVVFNRSGTANLIVECKSPDVRLSQSTFDQIAAYNLSLKVEYLIVSNGDQTFCCHLDLANQSYAYLNHIPPFEALDHNA